MCAKPTMKRRGETAQDLATLAVIHPPCEKCTKPQPLCVCDRIEVLETGVRVVILQHPQEDDKVLGTAKLVTLSLPKAEIRVGLSWASLAQAVGDEKAKNERWAVLAGAKLPGATTSSPAGAASEDVDAEKEANSPAKASDASPPLGPPGTVKLLGRHGEPLVLGKHKLDGILVLDGTWSQAKTLWWRNPWLLKLPRIALVPREPSLYGKLRKEPRRDWVSTLEAIADVLPPLGEAESVRDSLRKLLRTMLQRARDAAPSHKKPEPIRW